VVPGTRRQAKGTDRSKILTWRQKMTWLINMTTYQIINYNGKIPQEVVIEDKKQPSK
jgi:hypothetical protein